MGFTPRATRRISEAVKRDEHRYRGGGLPTRPDGTHGGVVGWIAQTGASGVPAISGSTPGSATVTLYAMVSGVLTSLSATVTAYNMTATAVGASKFIGITWRSGGWFVDLESC